MIRALGTFEGASTHLDVSFTEVDAWRSLPSSVGTPLTTTAVLFGDEAVGPVLLMLDLQPGVALPSSPAHGHASDSWRTSLRGTLDMGPDSYGPGDFRFQHGWKPYASDNLATGPDGGWTALLFGDRRGMRPRFVSNDRPSIAPVDVEWAEYLEVHGDLSSTDDAAAPGRSAFASTFDDGSRGARVNGTFRDVDGWVPGPGGHLAAAAMGDRVAGPLVLLLQLEPGATAPPLAVGSDVLQLVCRGELHGPDRVHHTGDARVVGPGTVEARTAGATGASEVIVIGDRRGALPDPSSLTEGAWGPVLAEVVEFLRGRVDVRAARSSSARA